MFDIKPITSPNPVDCGATCLKMLLSYYGEEVALDQLIKECNTRFIGCTAKDILRVGNAHGLSMTAWSEEGKDLMKQDRPAIIWWLFDHFVVFCGLDDDERVVVANPDLGMYSMRADTFASFYSGVALTNGEPHDK